MCTLERIPYIFLSNDAIDIYIILTESHDHGLSNKPIYILRNILVNEVHAIQPKGPKHLKHFWGHCTYQRYSPVTPSAVIVSWQGTKMAALLQSWSVIVKIMSYFPDFGNFMMKSMDTFGKGVYSDPQNWCNVLWCFVVLNMAHVYVRTMLSHSEIICSLASDKPLIM